MTEIKENQHSMLLVRRSCEQHLVLAQMKDAQLLGRAIRKHWGIENEAHWMLDCTFVEDYCRIRSFHSPRNFALLRRIALNALNRERTYKRSLRAHICFVRAPGMHEKLAKNGLLPQQFFTLCTPPLAYKSKSILRIRKL